MPYIQQEAGEDHLRAACRLRPNPNPANTEPKSAPMGIKTEAHPGPYKLILLWERLLACGQSRVCIGLCMYILHTTENKNRDVL
jgi:hypothetical protein